MAAAAAGAPSPYGSPVPGHALYAPGFVDQAVVSGAVAPATGGGGMNGLPSPGRAGSPAMRNPQHQFQQQQQSPQQQQQQQLQHSQQQMPYIQQPLIPQAGMPGVVQTPPPQGQQGQQNQHQQGAQQQQHSINPPQQQQQPQQQPQQQRQHQGAPPPQTQQFPRAGVAMGGYVTAQDYYGVHQQAM